MDIENRKEVADTNNKLNQAEKLNRSPLGSAHVFNRAFYAHFLHCFYGIGSVLLRNLQHLLGLAARLWCGDIEKKNPQDKPAG